MPLRGAIGLITLSALLAACGGGSDLLLPGASEPASVTLLQGDGQNGRVGEPLPQPIVAEVKDGAGRPVEGATVVFVLTDPAPGAAVTPDTVTTDADGNVTAQVVLGTRPGAQAGEVRALGGSGTATATAPFTLTAVSENANGITAVSGGDQSGPVGSALASPLVVQVADAFGNPIAGVEVTWTAEGGGSVSSSTTSTDASGLTSVTRTLGPAAGGQSTLASVDGLAGSPVTFMHTATAGAASGLSIVSGDDQTGPVSTELPQRLVVEVRDAQANVVAGVPVTWVIGTGGGSINPATTSTDGAGQASTAWTLGDAPGDNTVSAVVGISVVEFSAKATAGAPARLSLRTQPSATAVSGVSLSQQPVIQLLDARGNPASTSGVDVTVALGSGGGTLGGTTVQRTDGNGRAAFAGLTISGSPGPRTLRFSAAGFASVSSAQIDVGAVPTVTTIVSDQPNPSTAGEAITVQFTVTSSAGTPTGLVTVADGGDTCTGTLSNGNGSCSLTLTNAGSRTLTATYSGGGGFGTSSDTKTHTVQAPPTPVLAIVQQPSSPATAGAAFSQQPVIQLRSGGGSDLTTPLIPVTAAIATGSGNLLGTITVVTDAQGRAAFTDLGIDAPGTYTLRFSTPGFTDATSGSIEVQAAAPSGTTSTISPAPASIPAGASSVITVTVKDASGRPLAGRTVAATAPGDPGNSITPASVQSGADGTATFGFSSTASGTTQTISVTVDGAALGDTQVTIQ